MATGVEELWQIIESQGSLTGPGGPPSWDVPEGWDVYKERQKTEEEKEAESLAYYEKLGIPKSAVLEQWLTAAQRESAARAQEEKPLTRWAWHYLGDKGWAWVEEPPPPYARVGFFGDYFKPQTTRPLTAEDWASMEQFGIERPTYRPPDPAEQIEAMRQFRIASEKHNNPIISDAMPVFSENRYESIESLAADIQSQNYEVISSVPSKGYGQRWLIATKDPETGVWGNFIQFDVLPEYPGGVAVLSPSGAVPETQRYSGEAEMSRIGRSVFYKENNVEKVWTYPNEMTPALWAKLRPHEKRRVKEIIESQGMRFEDWLREMQLFSEPEPEEEKTRPRPSPSLGRFTRW